MASTKTGQAKWEETKPHITVYLSQDEDSWLLRGHLYVLVGEDGRLTLERMELWDLGEGDEKKKVYE